MLAATGDAKFTDVIERALYNGINSGMSLDGTIHWRSQSAGVRSVRREKRFATRGTTPRVARRTWSVLFVVTGYFYSTSDDGIYVHLYDNAELDWHLENGIGLKVTQKTNYPWDGRRNYRHPAQPDRTSLSIYEFRDGPTESSGG